MKEADIEIGKVYRYEDKYEEYTFYLYDWNAGSTSEYPKRIVFNGIYLKTAQNWNAIGVAKRWGAYSDTEHFWERVEEVT